MSKVRLFLEMIKFEHTIFALPYAYIGMIMASFYKNGDWPGWGIFFWITMAMVGARSAAMALNRLIDMKIDAKNPRTADRELPRGAISILETVAFIVLSLGLLGVSAWMLNPLCFYLMPVAVFFLVLYPYTKRFTWACHLILGITDGLAPLGAWIAVTGSFDLPGLLLAGAVAAWIAAFDIIYACQDVDFDLREGLHSIPSRFGIAGGLWISRILDVATIVLFLLIPLYVQLGWIYLIGVAVVAVLLVYEHLIISSHDMSRIDIAFFKVNSIVATVAFVFTFTDIAWRLV
ncbi:UbiA-like polyprenyltransferase [Effusibacillus lacus]|uniref:4-hydroxybenzoate polyprenyltransferase n=1 Tax=Effusibacillus lacus TaxID=1348429 RepID=A0A292YHH0_9BACL|nr:UbiA-like polyprenyltransferase [Effusibacillus lacus]TCS72025.1 4-hydroxybenzoate polyprenyltransferase [Effusibacillus lacus]GAX90317.1 4-hydroxybenzoate octaprenyltransferase [Effusibacillus lacus]